MLLGRNAQRTQLSLLIVITAVTLLIQQPNGIQQHIAHIKLKTKSVYARYGIFPRSTNNTSHKNRLITSILKVNEKFHLYTRRREEKKYLLSANTDHVRNIVYILIHHAKKKLKKFYFVV